MAIPTHNPASGDDSSLPDPRSAESRRPVNIRSVALGVLGVLFISSLTAYNDFVVFNTYLIGSALPLGLLLFFLGFVLLVNVPLNRWRPHRALGRGELAVALGMTLVSCGIPASGLMRYLPAQLVAPYYHAAGSAEIRAMLDESRLADWVYPTFASDSARDRAADPIVTHFWNRDPRPRLTWLDNWRAVPWAAWVRPAVSWGVLLVAVYGMIFCGAVIVRRQWVENERLPFPIATVFTSLIESPPRGRALNSLFSARSFWIAAGAVFAIHAVNALATYSPRHWPRIPLGYDLSTLLVNPPWSNVDWAFPKAGIYFSVVGMMFFVQTKVAFSLWVFYAVFYQAERMLLIPLGRFHEGMQMDQRFGALVVYAFAILYVGRGQWMLIARQMFRAPLPEEPQGRYLPYRAAGWGLVGCCCAIGAWLVAAGASVPGAAVIVLMLLMVLLVTARAIAETGMIFMQVDVPLYQPWVYAIQTVGPAMQTRTTMPSLYLAAVMGTVLARDVREPMPAYATHALKVADDNAFAGERDWRRAVPFMVVMALALLLAYVVSGAGMLYVEYNYSATLDREQIAPLNTWAMVGGARSWTIDPPTQYLPPGDGPPHAHDRLGNFTFGAAVTAMLSWLRLRYVGWPLHPLGFLLAYTYPLQVLWFSIFVGWLMKVVLTRFGGAELFRRSRAVFIGLILGEVMASAFWLVVSLVLSSMGMQYHKILLFPT